MTDLLIRDIPDDVLARLDQQAQRLGISRAEYLRRQMFSAATGSLSPVTRSSLQQFAETFSDLADAEIMDQAWR